jgi:hypothetical protein
MTSRAALGSPPSARSQVSYLPVVSGAAHVLYNTQFFVGARAVASGQSTPSCRPMSPARSAGMVCFDVAGHTAEEVATHFTEVICVPLPCALVLLNGRVFTAEPDLLSTPEGVSCDNRLRR